jgi:hypothetical protein
MLGSSFCACLPKEDSPYNVAHIVRDDLGSTCGPKLFSVARISSQHIIITSRHFLSTSARWYAQHSLGFPGKRPRQFGVSIRRFGNCLRASPFRGLCDDCIAVCPPSEPQILFRILSILLLIIMMTSCSLFSLPWF